MLRKVRMQEPCHGEKEPAMSKTNRKAFVDLLTEGALTRRNLVRGLAGIATATSLFHAGADNLDARKRKKRKGRGNGDNAGGVPGGGDTGPGGNECPLGIAIDVVGRIFVVDSGNNRVQAFVPSGTVLDITGSHARPGHHPDTSRDPGGKATRRAARAVRQRSGNHGLKG